jgi:formylmethanofuran dehydrogenase subunit A
VDEDTARTIDASNMLVMAGGVDIHNLGRRCIQPYRRL